MPEIPDPPKPPIHIPEDEIEKIPKDKPISYDEVIPAPVVIEQPKPIAPIPEVPNLTEIWFSFRTFGTDCKVRLSEQDRFRLKDCMENTIADAWQTLSGIQYNNLIKDCLAIRLQLDLCDWAYLQMLQQLASTFFQASKNEATLLTAFIYNQSGYKVRLARSKTNNLHMLVASSHLIYSMPYYSIGNDMFYPLNCQEDGLYVYSNSFTNEQALSLNIGKEQRFTANIGTPKLLTSKRYPEVSATVAANKNLIDFFNTYPQSQLNNDGTTKWVFYANTPLSQSVKDTLYPVLKNVISGKSERDAANIMINFVQTAFIYGYDNEIWGGDRPFFADETIHYPFSDCEDRAILFSRLVRDLLGLKIVLLYYPGHLATAVQFNQNISGDYLAINGKRYLVCDPTYIGASIGLTMPDMDNGKAKVIFLE